MTNKKTNPKMKKSTRNLLITTSISILILITITIFFADKIHVGIIHH